MSGNCISRTKWRTNFAVSGFRPGGAYFLFCLFCFTLSGCASMTHVVPIQMARVNQLEAYTQTFDFQSAYEDNALHSIEQMQWFNQRIDDVFLRLLGEGNWQQIKDRYGLGALRDELLRKDIYVRGFFNFSTYLDPVSPESFMVEGMGRFFLVRRKNQAILLSGDFHILPDRHSTKDLDRGYVVLDIALILSRIPEEVTYLHETTLKYKIYFDNSLKNKSVYRLDYQRQHEVHLPLSDAEELSGKTRIGGMRLDAKADLTERFKLLDYRGTQFIRSDYEKMLRQSRQRRLEE